VDKGCYVVPDVEVDPERVELAMISEAAPADPGDYYYADGDPLFQRTTVQAFKDAGVDVETVRDLMRMGVYLTTAVKCGKTGYGISTNTAKECSKILRDELALFPEVKVIMLMGDAAIKALNFISQHDLGKRAIPAGSTYKIRKGEYFYGDKRVFPSYLQAGPAFFIEKSKRRMIAEDIRNAMKILGIVSS
jgi:uracil-DNA glycosylase